MTEYLVPRLMAARGLTAARVQAVLEPVKGHELAKAALETAVLDAELRAHGMPLATYLGAVRDRVPAGVSVGIKDSSPSCWTTSSGYLAEGYVRIKLKIEPGWDIEPVRAVRETLRGRLPLQVDANTAYTLADADTCGASTTSGCCSSRSRWQENNLHGHAHAPERCWPPRSAWTSRSLPAGTPPPRSPWTRAGSSTSSPRGSAATWRPVASTTWRTRTASRCGAAACWRPESAAPRTSRWPPSRFTLPGDTSASARYFAEDITAPFHPRRWAHGRYRRAGHRHRGPPRRPGPADHPPRDPALSETRAGSRSPGSLHTPRGTVDLLLTMESHSRFDLVLRSSI